MRNYIEEEIDVVWTEIKEYVLSLKPLTKKQLIDEMYKNFRALNARCGNELKWLTDERIADESRFFMREDKISLIARCVEEKYYVFRDKDEHIWNKNVVKAIVDGKPFRHRWTNEEYL